MWYDPLEMAAIKGGQQAEADRRGITLEELLDEQKEMNDKKLYPEKLKAERPIYRESEIPVVSKPKKKGFWRWFFRLN